MISVIVPHLNQPGALRKCLQSLADQKAFSHDVEVLVVDNGSTPVPEDVCAAFANVRLLHQPIPGPGPARNLGAEAARGEILAFIDADCTASPQWLSVVEAAMETCAPPCVLGGDVRCNYADPDAIAYAEPFERIYAFRNRMYIEKQGFCLTGNLAMRPDVFARVGPFGGLDVAEDRDWGGRATALKIRMHFVENMIVYHPARKAFDELKRKWDRHISHDYADMRGAPGMVKWIVKAFALLASPLAEISIILTSDRVSGLQERWTAFTCLTRIRAFRARRMLTLAIRGDADRVTSAWNRTT